MVKINRTKPEDKHIGVTTLDLSCMFTPHLGGRGEKAHVFCGCSTSKIREYVMRIGDIR